MNVLANLAVKPGPKIGDKWFRLEDIQYAPPVDEWDNVVGTGRIEIKLRTYYVYKVTPKGVWISPGNPTNPYNLSSIDKRFILNSSRKRFACPTVEEAKESFKQRKICQRGIYAAKHAYVVSVLDLLERKKFNVDNQSIPNT